MVAFPVGVQVYSLVWRMVRQVWVERTAVVLGAQQVWWSVWQQNPDQGWPSSVLLVSPPRDDLCLGHWTGLNLLAFLPNHVPLPRHTRINNVGICRFNVLSVARGQLWHIISTASPSTIISTGARTWVIPYLIKKIKPYYPVEEQDFCSFWSHSQAPLLLSTRLISMNCTKYTPSR